MANVVFHPHFSRETPTIMTVSFDVLVSGRPPYLKSSFWSILFLIASHITHAMEKIHNNNLRTKILTPMITLLYILFFLYPVAVSTAGDSLSLASAEILVYCGSSGSFSTLDGRIWIGDNNSKYLPSEPLNRASITSEALQQPQGTEKHPYMTARLSYSQFTYKFPIPAGQYFIRLHFYPTSYSNLDTSKTFFSVKSNSFTLLNNFSASLAATADTIVKEFMINIQEKQMLNITFIPSSDYKNAFAFINGIEIVSMPLNLYYTAEDDDTGGLKWVGQVNPYRIENRYALETIYRVNVGGAAIPPGKDTGMYRNWDLANDYLTYARPGAYVVNGSINLTFLPSSSGMIQNYSAPLDVYRTAFTMGKESINNYRLTWEFPVDSVFTYFVRLHFCEIQFEITKAGNRVFEIYIANQTAETLADIISWTGGNGNGIPIYRDYAVTIGSKPNAKKQNISIALHPAPRWRTNYSDAILNGVEIFKIDNSGNLAGPNPDPLISPPSVSPPSTKLVKSRNSRSSTTIAIVVGVVSSFVIISILLLFIFRRRKQVKKESDSGSSTGPILWSQLSFSTNKSSKSRGGQPLPSDLCRHFSLSEIKTATSNFDKVFIIGVGGFGNVYKGFINLGSTHVAIKRLNPGSQQGELEFMTEIGMLSQLRHLHLVSLIGYCNDDGEMILVYDYMARGTLRDHLYNNDNHPLPWNQRLQICIGAARGLQYLHSGAKHVIIHRDVKTTNILLDEKWVAKVSDFGLSKMGPTTMSKAHVSTVVKGSFGYLDPEYYRRQQLTEKSDVYSFGVVLFEVLCARPPITRTVEKKQASLAVWAQQCYHNGTLDQIVDPYLKSKIAPECLKKYGEVAVNCLNDEGIKRPSMSDVVWGLEFALQLQENAEEDSDKFGGSPIDYMVSYPLMKNYTSDDSGSVFSNLGDHVMKSKTITTSTSSSDR